MTDPNAIPGSATVSGANKKISAVAVSAAAVAAEVESLLRQGQLKDAEIAILTLLQQPSKAWEYYVVLGQVYSAQKRVHEAREAYRHAVLVGPLQARPHYRLGEFLFRKGELGEAEEEFRTAIRINPRISDFHASLGALQLEQGWIEDAHSSLRRAIRLDRRSPRPREVLGRLLARKGHYRAAEKSLARALALDPKCRSALTSLANVFEGRGKTDKAAACKKRIGDLDLPDSAPDGGFPGKENAEVAKQELPTLLLKLFQRLRSFGRRKKAD